MSIILGRWPLIPEQHCTVSLPNGVIGSQISDFNAPNVFCERRLQIELTKIAFDLLTSNHGKPSTDPVIIDKHIRRLQGEFIEKLPPAFKLHAADEKWDDELPNLKRQREMFRISVFATMCSLLRPVILQSPDQTRTWSPSDRKLVAEHRASLLDVTIEMLESVGRLHTLMGGKHNRFFLLSFFTLEPAVLLGMCLMNPDIGKKKEGKQGSSASGVSRGSSLADDEQWKQGRKKIGDAVARLKILSEVSSIARAGVKVLETLVTSIDITRTVTVLNGTKKNKFRRLTSNSSSISPVNDSDLSKPRTPDTSEDLPVTSLQSSSHAVGTDEVSNMPNMPPYSQPSHPSQDSQLLNGINGWGNVEGLDMSHITPSFADWDLDFRDAFLFNDSGSLSNPAGSGDGALEPMVTIANVGVSQSAPRCTPSYANMAWPLYPPSWAWDSLASTTNPALSTPFVHQHFADTNAPMVPGHDYDWNLMGDHDLNGSGQ